MGQPAGNCGSVEEQVRKLSMGLRHKIEVRGNSVSFTELQRCYWEDVSLVHDGKVVESVGSSQRLCQSSDVKHLTLNIYGVFQSLGDCETYLEVWAKVVRALQECTSLQYMEIKVGYDFALSAKVLDLLAELLSVNSSLIGLGLSYTFLVTNYIILRPFLEAVSNNKTLQQLDMHSCPISHVENLGAWNVVMASLTPNEYGVQSNMSLRDLRLGHLVPMRDLSEFWNSFASMIERNTTLTTLGMRLEGMKVSEWVDFVHAMRRNRHVTRLLLTGSGLNTNRICDLLDNNYWVTSVEYEGFDNWFEKDELIQRQLKINKLLGPGSLQPTSCRVFLCGSPEAGKSTLRKQMEYILKQKAKPLHVMYNVSKRIGTHSRGVSRRTKGVEVVSTNVGENLKLSIWDMGGQDEFHAFHDLVIPNLRDTRSTSLFVVTCSLARSKGVAKSAMEIESEIRYWLRFLSSNTTSSDNSKPRVILIFTHVDWLRKKMNITNYVASLLRCVKETFAVRCKFSSREYFVTSHSTKMVEPFVECVVDDVRVMLSKASNVYGECIRMEKKIAEWKKGHCGDTIISWVDFVDIFKHAMWIDESKVVPDASYVQDLCRVVALELNRGGHIIFFEDLEDIVVIDPNWFGSKIIGPIVSITAECLDVNTGKPLTNEEGFIDRHALKSVMDESFKGTSKVDIEDVIRVLKRMKICYEKQSHGNGSAKRLIIPATLRDDNGLAHKGKRLLTWNADFARSSSQHNVIYVGRRLQCKDPDRTFFSAGFFSRLQVDFANSEIGECSTFRLEKNLMAFTANGKQVVVEYSGNVIGGTYFDGFIDVMVQSVKSPAETLQYVKDEVLQPIRKLCASPAFGCQGVTLSEGILRPRCVKELWVCIDRSKECINEKSLIERLLSEKDFEGYVHHWRNHEFDCAESLLGEVVWKADVVNVRMASMMELSSALMAEEKSLHPDEVSTVAGDRIVKHDEPVTCLEDLYARLRDYMKDVGQSVVARVNSHTDEKLKPMYDMQSKMLLEISRNINRVISHSVQSLERQVPCYVYVTSGDLGMSERLISSLVPGMKSVQLHLMCEHRGHIHAVDGQEGVPLRLESEALRGARPYVVWGLRIMTMLMKVGAHVAAGLGSMVPELEKSLLKGVASVIPSVPSDALGREGTPSEQVDLMRLKHRAKDYEKETCQQWLVNFLGGRDIQSLFRLQRVRYTDGSNEFAWVCEKHINEGQRERILRLCPVGRT